MTDVGPNKKQIAQYIAGIFGGNCSVAEYHSDDQKYSIDILKSSSDDTDTVASYSTLGLHETPNPYGTNNEDIPVEIVAASCHEETANILATLAFRMQRDHHRVSPDTVEQDVVSTYFPNLQCKHILFVDVFSWNIAPLELADNSKTVHWLQALPITDGEFEFAKAHGIMALSKKFPHGAEFFLRFDRSSFV